MILRAVAAAVAVVAVSLGLTGCLAPAPEPTPKSTAVFASEDEAFAAAEETYRAYVDAGNARRADEHSTPDPQSFLVADALESDIAANQKFDEVGLTIVGESRVVNMTRLSADLKSGRTTVQACMDDSGTSVINAAGEDVTRSDRDPTVELEVSLIPVGEALRIDGMRAIESETC